MPRAKKTNDPKEPIMVAEAEVQSNTTKPSKSRKMAFKKMSPVAIEVTPQQEVSHIQLEPEMTDSLSASADNVIEIKPLESSENQLSANDSGLSVESALGDSLETVNKKRPDKTSILEFSQDMKEYLLRQEKIMDEMTQMMRHVYNHTKRQQVLAKARITVFVIIGIIFSLIGAVFAPTFKKAFSQYNDVLKIGGGGVKSDTVETIFDKPK